MEAYCIGNVVEFVRRVNRRSKKTFYKFSFFFCVHIFSFMCLFQYLFLIFLFCLVLFFSNLLCIYKFVKKIIFVFRMVLQLLQFFFLGIFLIFFCYRKPVRTVVKVLLQKTKSQGD